jgi:hypothetical protein
MAFISVVLVHFFRINEDWKIIELSVSMSNVFHIFVTLILSSSNKVQNLLESM